MKKSLTINATRDGKKVAKSFGFVNPDVANSLVGGFAQMVNALSNDTFVNAEVVKKMDTTEEETTPEPAGKIEDEITVTVSTGPVGGVEVTGSTLPVSQNGFLWTVTTLSNRTSETLGYVGKENGTIMTEINAIYKYDARSFFATDGSGTTYTPQAGDIVVFHIPGNDEYTAAVRVIRIVEE